ncbi:hypothetical protein M5E87_26730 [Flavonifractor plautii]|nr:hypothetical protein M5E87_26730 [Flavonifractor plautii]
METNLCVVSFGGQGVMTLGKFLADATCNSTDKNVTFFPPTALSSAAAPPTASWSSPTRPSAPLWAT